MPRFAAESDSESRSVMSNSLRPPGLHSPWNSPGQNTGVGSLSLLQGIFPSQGSNPGLPHCRQMLYQLSHQGSPRILEWVACPFSSRSSRCRNWTRVSCIVGRFFTSWATGEAQPSRRKMIKASITWRRGKQWTWETSQKKILRDFFWTKCVDQKEEEILDNWGVKRRLRPKKKKKIPDRNKNGNMFSLISISMLDHKYWGEKLLTQLVETTWSEWFPKYVSSIRPAHLSIQPRGQIWNFK